MNVNLSRQRPNPRTNRDNRIVVIPSARQYVHQMEDLHQVGYDYRLNDYEDYDDECLTADKFATHLDIFPEGQFIAVEADTNQVVGLTVSMRLNFDLHKPDMHSWTESTGGGWLTTHDPSGEWLYGVDSVVHPDYRSLGIGGMLIEARYDIVRRLNLRGMVAGSLIMDYHLVAHDLTVEQYVREVVNGQRWDTNLSKQLKKGFQVYGLIPQYTIAESSLNWGVLIAWENPDYQRQPARVAAAASRRYPVPQRPARQTGVHGRVS